MVTPFHPLKLIWLALTALTLSGCGGGDSGGGTGGTLANPVAPPPPPPNYDTAEYRANYGLDAINALAAYDDGLSGEGIRVAVIDTGVDLSHPDLNDNINPASRGVSTPTFNGASDTDAEGHGTAVAGIIAAEKNNSNTHGVAYKASLLAINATNPSTCPGDCEFAQSDLVSAMDYAVAQGARIINLSLGGSMPGTSLSNAMQRAVNAGAVIVISAGNESADVPSEFAQIAGAPWAQGQIIIVGATDQNNLMADFSNKAGEDLKHVYLVAPGVSIRTTGKGGAQVLATGTSFSAPHASGALALLAEKFPNLSAADLAEILLTSANDLGDAGVDAEYGQGLIDLAQAIAPIGTVGVPTNGGIVPANTQAPPLSVSALQLSPVFGDALINAPALQNAMALDGYQRSYEVDLTRAISRPSAMASLTDISHRLHHEKRQHASVGIGTTLDLTVTPPSTLSQLLDPQEHTQDTAAQIRLVRTLPSGIRMTLAVNDHGQEGQAAQVFTRPLGFAYALDQTLTASWAWPLGRNSEAGLEVLRGRSGNSPAQWTHLWVDSRWTDTLRTTFGLGQLTEQGSVLGAVPAGALRLGRSAATRFVDAQARWSPTPALDVYLGATWGRTTVADATGSLLRVDGAITTWSAEAGITWRGVWGTSDHLDLRLALPQRVETGSVIIGQIIGRDYAQNELLFADSRVSLAPTGREMDVELSYGLPLGEHGLMRAHMFFAREPGHQAEAADALAAIVSFTRPF